MVLRSSNLVPKSVNRFDKVKQLTPGSLRFTKGGLVAAAKWAKIIQFRQRTVFIPVPEIRGSILCPVAAVRAVLAISSSSKDGPLIGLSDTKPFTYSMLQDNIKRVVDDIGLDKQDFSSHSLRQGSVTWAQRCGVPPHVIKVFGDWSPDTFLKYLQFPLETRTTVGLQLVCDLKDITL